MSCCSGGKSKPQMGWRGPGTPCKSEKEASVDFFNAIGIRIVPWPAPGSEDTELGVLMELEVGHGETEVYAGVQA
jgi:hypothetical protein